MLVDHAEKRKLSPFRHKMALAEIGLIFFLSESVASTPVNHQGQACQAPRSKWVWAQL